MLVSPPLPLQHHFVLSSFNFHHTNCKSFSSLATFLIAFFFFFSYFFSFAHECYFSPDLSLGLSFFTISFSWFLSFTLTFLFFWAFSSLKWMRDFSCFYLSASGEKGTSSRFSLLNQESYRRHILAQSRGMHLTCSAVALEVKFLAEGMVWVAEKVDVQQMDNFPVHMRMHSCLDTMTEQVCTPCYLCASLICWGLHRALPLLHTVFPKSQGRINLHCTRIPWSQTEHSAGAAQVTESFDLTAAFEGNVPKFCF